MAAGRSLKPNPSSERDLELALEQVIRGRDRPNGGRGRSRSAPPPTFDAAPLPAAMPLGVDDLPGRPKLVDQVRKLVPAAVVAESSGTPRRRIHRSRPSRKAVPTRPEAVAIAPTQRFSFASSWAGSVTVPGRHHPYDLAPDEPFRLSRILDLVADRHALVARTSRAV